MSERDERTHPQVAQIKSSPDQYASDDRAKEWRANAHIGGGSTAEVTGQQDCTKDGGARNQIDHRAGQFENSQLENQALRKSKLSEAFHHRGRLHQF